jgi:hypothetical protein
VDNLIVLSHATYLGPSGATAAATYSFVTSDYGPPVQERYIESDVVKNQNGKFKYLYDNGPGFKKWQPFKIHCEQAWATEIGATAGGQYTRLLEMWDHIGVLGLGAPDGVHTVHWAGDHERAFRVFPSKSNTPQEFTVVVQFEEGQ